MALKPSATTVSYEFQDPAPVFAGAPGKANCHGKSVSAWSQRFGTFVKAATALGYSSVGDLQAAIQDFGAG